MAKVWSENACVIFDKIVNLCSSLLKICIDKIKKYFSAFIINMDWSLTNSKYIGCPFR